MTAEMSFAARLEMARLMIAARSEAAASSPMRDQIEAAARDARHVVGDAGRLLRMIQPDRGWREKIVENAADERYAYLLAGVLGCQPCPHLRRGGPQPGFAQLPLQRLACRRCVAIVRRPPSGDADRCDMCAERGVLRFVPFTCAVGPVLVMGDVCASCAGALGVGEEVASDAVA